MFTYDEDHNFSGFWFYKDNDNVSYIVNDKGKIVSSSNSENLNLESGTFIRRIDLNEGEIGKTQNVKNDKRIVYIAEKTTIDGASILYNKNTLEIVKSSNVNYVGKYYVEFNKFENDNNQLIQLIVDLNSDNIINPNPNNSGYKVDTTGMIGTNFNIKDGNIIVYAYRSKNISDNEFENNITLLGVHLTSGVTEIGKSAFYNCSKLKGTIKIPYGVTEICSSVFYNCDGLTEIIIPDSVETIKSGAFSNCDGLTQITIPNSVTTIDSNVFFNCINLKEVVISNNVDTLNSQLFWNCEALGQIEIPNNVKTIGKRAFSNCIGLTKIIIPNTIETIGEDAFTNCNIINTITITGCNKVDKVNDIITAIFNINETTYKSDKPDTINNTITFTKI